MTVEKYLVSKIPGYPVTMLDGVLEGAAFSPALAAPPLRALDLSDDIADFMGDEEWMRSLKYALSTLYYSVSGVFSGGSRSEQVGDVHASLSGFVVTQSDREYYRSLGDKLRKELGYEPEEVVQEQGGMFDATSLRTPNRPRRWS